MQKMECQPKKMEFRISRQKILNSVPSLTTTLSTMHTRIKKGRQNWSTTTDIIRSGRGPKQLRVNHRCIESPPPSSSLSLFPPLFLSLPPFLLLSFSLSPPPSSLRLPHNLRYTSKAMRSMAHRSHEAAEGVSACARVYLCMCFVCLYVCL